MLPGSVIEHEFPQVPNVRLGLWSRCSHLSVVVEERDAQ